MGKKEIKRKHKNLDISVIDYLSKFDPTNTNKLTEFLVRRFEEGMTNNARSMNSWVMDYFKPESSFESILGEVLVDYMGGRANIELLHLFSEHLEAGRVSDKDINNYSCWEDVRKSTNKAQMNFMDKEMKKQTKILFNDKTWLILKPLSLKSSQIYGLSTRWCTSMKHEPSYFYEYSKRGILIYCINKVSGKKFGFFSSPNEFSVWDSIDNRIDSMETRIPSEIIDIIRKESDLDTTPVNKELFSEESMKQHDDFYNMGKKKTTLVNTLQPILDLQPILGEDMDAREEEPMVMPVNNFTITHQGENMADGNTSLMTVSHQMVNISEESVETESVEEDWSPRGANVAFGNMGGVAVEAQNTGQFELRTDEDVMDEMDVEDSVTTWDQLHSTMGEMGVESGEPQQGN